MQEVKFRAWDKLEECMYTNVQNGIYEDPDDWLYFGDILGLERFEIMQFTGLKDANDIEIYEGDILKIIPINLEHYPISLFFVRKIDSPWGTTYTWEPISGYECSTHIMDWDSENKKHLNVKVIGNIFKNKNLLEDKQ